MKFYYLFLCSIFYLATSFAQTFPVGHTTITFNDASRSGGFGSGGGPGRQIQTEIYYPAVSAGNNTALANGAFPIIVFWHGFAMAWDAYQNLWDDFASKGYIIAFPRTEGSLIPAPSHNNFGLDLAIVEVKLQNLNTDTTSIFYTKVVNKSAIMGHSMGGGATFIAAANNSSPTLQAVVGLAPAETNPSAISAGQNVTVNALILSGSSDGVTPPASNHLPIYTNLASSCKTFLSITNGSHCYFANSNFNCDFGELTTGAGSLSRGAQQDITSDYVNLWLDFQLKSSCSSWDEFLDSLVVSTRVIAQQSCNYGYLNPDVSISGDSSFCQGENSLLYASQNPSYTYSWFLNNNPLTNNADSLLASSAGNYIVCASNAYGCSDSSALFSLNAIPTYSIQDTAYACIGSTYTFPDGFTSNQNTSHISFLSSSLNCDSTIERFLFFSNVVNANAQLELCAGTSVIIGGLSFNSDTVFVDTLLNGSSFGCDSITTYAISTRLPDSTIIETAICQGDNYLLASGLFVNQAGFYPISYSNQFGCDSVFAVDLTVGSQVPLFNVEFFDLNSNQFGDTFYLVLLDTLTYDSLVWTTDGNSSLISQSGDTAYFVLDFTGVTFTVTLTLYKDGCARSAVTDLAIVRIKELFQNGKISVFPSPTKGLLQISADQPLQLVQVYNLLGELMLEKVITSKDIDLDFSKLSEGVYLIKTPFGTSRFLKN